jgi:hypothetical protein
MIVPFLLASGCAGGEGQQPVVETAAVEMPEIAVTPTPRSIPTEEPKARLSLSEQIYSPASGAFQIQLPVDWNCSESGDYQVNCESGDAGAALQARISATGYELTDDSLFAFAHAELVHRYGSKKEYVETEKQEQPGTITSLASWRDGENYWDSVDTFIRQGRGILHLTFASTQTQSALYSGLYEALASSLKIFPEKLTGDALYPFRKTVAARDAFFEINVPVSWGRYIDTQSVEKTIVEGYTSPDQRASVQIAIYKQGTFIEQDAKAFNTREIMFELYGYDLKNSDDRSLPDGRERLTWYAAEKDINGITDFDTYVNALYLLTITWEPSTEALYLPVLEEILGSFTRE